MLHYRKREQNVNQLNDKDKLFILIADDKYSVIWNWTYILYIAV